MASWGKDSRAGSPTLSPDSLAACLVSPKLLNIIQYVYLWTYETVMFAFRCEAAYSRAAESCQGGLFGLGGQRPQPMLDVYGR